MTFANTFEDTFAYELVAGSIKRHLSSKNGVASGDLFKIPRSMIKVLPGYNVRETSNPRYQERVRQLANSMVQNGWFVTEPIGGFVANEGGVDVFYLTKGHTRLAGYDLAKAEGAKLSEVIPAIPMPRGTGMLELTLDLHHSNTSAMLDLIELGTLCQRLLLKFGMSPDEAAHALGITRKQLDDAVFLRTSPKGVQDLVISDKVSATTALQALRKYGSGALDYLNMGISRANKEGKTKATGKHFETPSWNRRVVEKRLEQFREMQRLKGYQEEDILPEDPMQALQHLMARVYPDLSQEVATLSLPEKKFAKSGSEPCFTADDQIELA